MNRKKGLEFSKFSIEIGGFQKSVEIFQKTSKIYFLDFLSLDDNIFSKQTQIVICALLTRFSEHFEVSK